MSKETGTVGWFPMWCEGKTAAVQCDLSVFIGNDLVQRIENKLAKSSILYSKGDPARPRRKLINPMA